GMGEPLLNAQNVLKSLAVITDSDLLAFGKKHISLSTVGITPALPLLAQGPEVGLTISLSAPDDALRDQIMPVNKKYPTGEIKKALAAWPLARGRRITIAYVLLKGVNDSPKQALALSRFLAGLKVKINLIPFNPWPGAPYEAPEVDEVEKFKSALVSKNHTVIVRWSKGGKVSAACGQLAGSRKMGQP
ncbi:23S rRNA (adenine(2503)-C(2))-methyltransferase RlmN, partial [Deltaproteobacteria bacterium OttesenSCG-928-K17]|nr:23S rRNA (adenine(2503)-C(2))-methyltransferase RlmN [Deltaproteobacteria bacterium OttesenSCG-928-K17]